MENKMKPENALNGLGDVIEMYQIQVLVIALVLFHIFVHYLESIQEHVGHESFYIYNGLQVLNFFTSFSSIALNLETLIVVVSFGGEIFSHFGYLTDVIN